jgi:hypothetical protein
MDGTTFDAVARRLASGLSRRQALRGLVAGALAAVGAGTGLGTDPEQTVAADRVRCLKAGVRCTSSKQCCTKKTNRICKQPLNAGNSDRVCCGGEGATCGGKNDDGDDIRPYCCMGYSCSSTTSAPGKCQKG